MKGSQIGVELLFARQVTLYESQCIRQGKCPSSSFSPRTTAIQSLNKIIEKFQKEHHAIILLIDANQSLQECHNTNGVKQYSIEWLRIQHGMDDPFVKTLGQCPNSTTQLPNRDIDYILTFGIDIKNISTLAPNIPSHSDHLGFIFDVDVHSYFSSSFSNLYDPAPRSLTANNEKSVSSYIKYVSDQVKHHKLDYRLSSLLQKAIQSPGTFLNDDHFELNQIDQQLTIVMLNGEKSCSRKQTQRQPRSPKLCSIGRTYAYWKQKWSMSQKKIFHWKHLHQLKSHTDITDPDHHNTDSNFIHSKLCRTRAEWKVCKKQSSKMHKQFLEERAAFYATKIRSTHEKAKRAIIRSEESCQAFASIRDILNRNNLPLAQVDIQSNDLKDDSYITLTN